MGPGLKFRSLRLEQRGKTRFGINAQRETQFRLGRRFERRQGDQRQVEAENRLKPRHWKALDGFGLNQIGEQRQRRFHQRIEPQNADPAHLDQADDGRGRAGDDPVADPRQLGLVVGTQLRQGSPAMRAAAEEALLHFPPAQATAQLRDLLGRREFIIQNPDLAVRLLDRAAQIGSSDLEAAMRTLVPLRFRFWNPALVRVANKARTLLQP